LTVNEPFLPYILLQVFPDTRPKDTDDNQTQFYKSIQGLLHPGLKSHPKYFDAPDKLFASALDTSADIYPKRFSLLLTP
jgi:hypothetical protein